MNRKFLKQVMYSHISSCSLLEFRLRQIILTFGTVCCLVVRMISQWECDTNVCMSWKHSIVHSRCKKHIILITLHVNVHCECWATIEFCYIFTLIQWCMTTYNLSFWKTVKRYLTFIVGITAIKCLNHRYWLRRKW